MSTLTSKLNLIKPDTTDPYDIEIHNGNMDILDEEISNKMDVYIVNGDSSESTETITNTGIYIYNKIDGPDGLKGIFVVQVLGKDGAMQQQWINASCFYTRYKIPGTTSSWSKISALTAERLLYRRTINGTEFTGISNITTDKWGKPRKISIAGVEKTVDGSSDVSFSLGEMQLSGAAGLKVAYGEAVGFTNENGYYARKDIVFSDPFIVAPNIQVTKFMDGSANPVQVGYIGASATGVTLRIFEPTGNVTEFLNTTVSWLAVGKVSTSSVDTSKG